MDTALWLNGAAVSIAALQRYAPDIPVDALLPRPLHHPNLLCRQAVQLIHQNIYGAVLYMQM